MTEIKDLITIGTLIFMAGGVLQIVRTLQKNFEEIKIVVKRVEEFAHEHETRITLLENIKCPMRRRKTK